MVIDEPSAQLAEVLQRAVPRFYTNSDRREEIAAVKDLDSGARYLAHTQSMAAPPGACIEYSNILFFSGVISGWVETNFTLGVAFKPGEPYLYCWEPEKKKEEDAAGGQRPPPRLERHFAPERPRRLEIVPEPPVPP